MLALIAVLSLLVLLILFKQLFLMPIFLREVLATLEFTCEGS